MERIDSLIQAGQPEPILATTPSPIAISELARRTEALESALRELTLEVQKLSAGS